MAIVRGKLLTSIIPSSISSSFRVWASHWADHGPRFSSIPTPSTPPTADQKTRKPKGHIGEPSPYRDQVGTVQQEGEATHCSFSGPIKQEGILICFSPLFKG